MRTPVLLLCLTALLAAEDKVVFRGSVAVKPIVDACAKAFAAAHPGVTVGEAGSTSDVSIQAVISGEAQLGALVKDLTAEQKAAHPDLRTIRVALDGLVLVVNKANAVTGVSKAQVIDLLSGAIANWKDVGGADARPPGGADEELRLAASMRDVAEATRSSSQRIAEVLQASGGLHRLAESLATSQARAQQVLGG